MFPIKICEKRSITGRGVSLLTPLLVAAVLFLGAGTVWTALAQSRTNRISGEVLCNGESVIGASVLIKGTTTGTVTDVDGRFTLMTAPQDVLVVSAIGYETKEVSVDGHSTLNIILAEENLLLDDAVVVGYGV